LAGLQQAGAVLPGAGLALFGFGALAVITMPLAGVILGFIMGAVHAFLYNVAAKYVGGLELNLK
jgi:hypothetical protein